MLEINAGKLRQGHGKEFLQKSFAAGVGKVISRGSKNEGFDLLLTAVEMPSAAVKRDQYMIPRELYAGTIKAARNKIDNGIDLLVSRELGVAFQLSTVENNAGRSYKLSEAV